MPTPSGPRRGPTRGGKCVGIHCDQPAKILQVETQAKRPTHHRPANLGVRVRDLPQTSVKAVGGYGTSVGHMLTLALDDPSMDDGLRAALAAHEIVLDEE